MAHLSLTPGQAHNDTSARWRRVRQFTQLAAVTLFFLLAFLTYRESAAFLPLDLFFRVDPLVAFGAMVSSRALIGALLLAGVALVLGLVFGRAWCGWLCPLGALLDWVSPKNSRVAEVHKGWKRLKYLLFAVLVTAAALGNLSFMFLDPITLVNRTFGAAVLPAFNAILVGVETALYPVEPLQPALDWIEQTFRGTVLPAQQTFYELGWVFAVIFAGVIALNWIVPRFWCRYLCPLGAIYALEARFAWLRPRAARECNHCSACMRVCPTGAITVSKSGFAVDRAECVVCLDCVAECPQSVIIFQFGNRATGDRGPETEKHGLPSPVSGLQSPVSGLPTRRQFLGSAFAGIAAVALFRAAPSAQRDDAHLIRPPGARENNLLDKCIRCGECSKVCPTGGLQASVFQSGLEGLWTPVLVPRIGYCDFSCRACGQICPTGAIPTLTLEEKRQRQIGSAYIDQNRCIPWASYRTCVVCEEMCPVPDKAVRLDVVDVVSPDGKPIHLQRPRVVADLCIGCGLCEYKCPLTGPAAIRIYAPMKLPPIA